MFFSNLANNYSQIPNHFSAQFVRNLNTTSTIDKQENDKCPDNAQH